MSTTPFRPYVSHKRVEAARILNVTPLAGKDGFAVEVAGPACSKDNPDGATVVTVEPIVFARHFPDPGDYLVRYADGYLSVSPRAAFEEGYRLAPVLVAVDGEAV